MPAESNSQQISIKVDGRSLLLNVRLEDEEYIRLAARKIDDRLREYKARYPKVDIVNLLIFTAVELIANSYEEKKKYEDSLSQRSLEKLNDSLDEILDSLK